MPATRPWTIRIYPYGIESLTLMRKVLLAVGVPERVQVHREGDVRKTEAYVLTDPEFERGKGDPEWLIDAGHGTSFGDHLREFVPAYLEEQAELRKRGEQRDDRRPAERAQPARAEAEGQGRQPVSEDLADATDRLEIRGKIDSGVFGTIWRAFDKRLQREVAVKIVRESMADESSAIQHARVLARVRDTRHVVIVHEVASVRDPEGGMALVPAVVTELIEGCTLDERLTRPLDRDEAGRIGAGLLAGVAAIHEVGVAHMDLHVRNVMVTKGDEAKVIDILYRGTLAVQTTARREHHLRRDAADAAGMLAALLDHAEVDLAALTVFRRAARTGAGLDEVRSAFEAALRAAGTPVPTQRRGRGSPGLDATSPAGQCRLRILGELHAGLLDSPTAWWRMGPETGESMDDVAREAEWLRHRGWIEASIAGDATQVSARLTASGRDIVESGLPVAVTRAPATPALAIGSKAIFRYRASDGEAEILAGTIREVEHGEVLVEPRGGAQVPVDLSASLGPPWPFTSDTDGALRAVQWEREGYRVHPALERSWGVYLRVHR
ncbi:MAG: protein kinase [Pseudomonadota bacterium]|nr:protein kinase [Pseudomonadota bacterium]